MLVENESGAIRVEEGGGRRKRSKETEEKIGQQREANLISGATKSAKSPEEGKENELEVGQMGSEGPRKNEGERGDLAEWEVAAAASDKLAKVAASSARPAPVEEPQDEEEEGEEESVNQREPHEEAKSQVLGTLEQDALSRRISGTTNEREPQKNGAGGGNLLAELATSVGEGKRALQEELRRKWGVDATRGKKLLQLGQLGRASWQKKRRKKRRRKRRNELRDTSNSDASRSIFVARDNFNPSGGLKLGGDEAGQQASLVDAIRQRASLQKLLLLGKLSAGAKAEVPRGNSTGRANSWPLFGVGPEAAQLEPSTGGQLLASSEERQQFKQEGDYLSLDSNNHEQTESAALDRGNYMANFHPNGSQQGVSAASDGALAQAGDGEKRMIPIEIIGLDPATTDSILFPEGQGAEREPSGSSESGHSGDFISLGQHQRQQQHYEQAGPADELAGGLGGVGAGIMSLGVHNNHTLSPARPRGLPGRGSSVVHVHHFHHTSGPVLASVADEESVSQAAEQQARPEASEVASGQQQQVFVDERGQVVQVEPLGSNNGTLSSGDHTEGAHLAAADEQSAGEAGSGPGRDKEAEQEADADQEGGGGGQSQQQRTEAAEGEQEGESVAGELQQPRAPNGSEGQPFGEGGGQRALEQSRNERRQQQRRRPAPGGQSRAQNGAETQTEAAELESEQDGRPGQHSLGRGGGAPPPGDSVGAAASGGGGHESGRPEQRQQARQRSAVSGGGPRTIMRTGGGHAAWPGRQASNDEPPTAGVNEQHQQQQAPLHLLPADTLALAPAGQHHASTNKFLMVSYRPTGAASSSSPSPDSDSAASLAGSAAPGGHLSAPPPSWLLRPPGRPTGASLSQAQAHEQLQRQLNQFYAPATNYNKLAPPHQSSSGGLFPAGQVGRLSASSGAHPALAPPNSYDDESESKQQFNGLLGLADTLGRLGNLSAAGQPGGRLAGPLVAPSSLQQPNQRPSLQDHFFGLAHNQHGPHGQPFGPAAGHSLAPHEHNYDEPVWSSDDERLLANYMAATGALGDQVAHQQQTAPASPGHTRIPLHLAPLLRARNTFAGAPGATNTSEQLLKQLQPRPHYPSLMAAHRFNTTAPILANSRPPVEPTASSAPPRSQQSSGGTQNRFELTMASDRTPSKVNKSLSGGRLGGANNTGPSLEFVAPPSGAADRQIFLSGKLVPSSPTTNGSHQAATSRQAPRQTLSSSIGSATTSPSSQDGDMLAPSSGGAMNFAPDSVDGLSNLALAFIFIVSLLTFVIIAG